MAWIGPVVGAAAGVLGDVMSQQGQQSTNAMSTANMMQQEQWQERMSDTAMVRRVADLRNAGLNPLLAVNTSGAQVSSVAPAQLNNPDAAFQNLGNQATNAMQQYGAIQKQQADIQKSQADANKATTEAGVAARYADPAAQNALDMARHQHDLVEAQADQLERDYRLGNMPLEQLMGNPDFASQYKVLQYNAARLDNQRVQAGMPRLENDAAWQRAHPQLAGWLGSGLPDAALNTGAKVFNTLMPSKVLTGRIPPIPTLTGGM